MYFIVFERFFLLFAYVWLMSKSLPTKIFVHKENEHKDFMLNIRAYVNVMYMATFMQMFMYFFYIRCENE